MGPFSEAVLGDHVGDTYRINIFRPITRPNGETTFLNATCPENFIHDLQVGPRLLDGSA